MKAWLNAFFATFRRELKGICASPSLVICCFYIPVFWTLVIWALLGQGVVQKAPVAFIDQDNSPLSRSLAREIAACRGIAPETWLNVNEALSAMKAGNVYGVILIPPGYSREMLSGRGSSVSLWLDENRYAAAGVIESELSSLFAAASLGQSAQTFLKLGATPAQAQRMEKAVHADFYALGNEQSSFLAFLGSNLIPSAIMISAMLGFLTAFLRELWHASVNSWLACAQNSLGAALLGKLLPWYSLYALILLFYMALFSGEGGFNITGSLFGWFLLCALCLADFAAAAILMAAIAPTWRMALVLGAGYSAPALPYSGFSIPLDSMGHYARLFGECLPLTWLVQGQALEWTLGATLADASTPLTAMAIIFIILLCPGVPLLGWSYRRKALQESEASHAGLPGAERT